MAAKRMTANPVKPARYRPGKAAAEETSSEEEEDDEEQEERPPSAAPPKATSFPSNATKVTTQLQKVGLNTKDKQNAEAARYEAEKIAKAVEDDGFVTEESEDDEDSENDSADEEDSGSSEETSSEEEVPKRLLRPTFIKKGSRKESETLTQTKNEEQTWVEEEARRKEKADALIQEQLEKDAAARAAGKKDWDDDEIEEIDQVDDRDGLDPEIEHAAWKLRELKRLKREREAIEAAERDREEVERRRNLSKEERDAEDREFLEAQKEAREGKGKMSYMQKYFHKGAFYQDDETSETLANRDIMGSRIADDVANRELLPQFMQIRDMTKLGRKGRTKYKDLKTEDTGRWGEDLGPGSKNIRLDDRFKSDKERERSGANAAPLGERKKVAEEIPTAPRAQREKCDHYRPGSEPRRDPHQERTERRRSYSRSRSPHRRRERRRSASDSRSPSAQRHRQPDHRARRKRSSSPYGGRYGSDKRQRMDTR